MRATNITQDELDYLKTQLEETNGIISWKTSGPGRKSSLEAGTVLNNYIIIRYTYESKKKTIYGHRLVWQMYNGLITDDSLQIDHLDRNEQNNDITNLSLGTTSDNLLNRKTFGIVSEKYIVFSRNRYIVNIVLNKTNKTLLNKNLVYAGSYKELDDAITARDNKLTLLNQIL